MRYPLLLLVIFAGLAQADVYKTVTESGEVIYSDTPSEGAERVRLPELPTYKPAPLPRPIGSPKPVKSDEYDSMVFMKPRDNDTIRNNLGIIQVEVRLDPALKHRQKHKIQYYLDGKPHGPLVDNTGLTFSNIERGTHVLAASVVDANGTELINTAQITVFVKRESILNEPDKFEPAPPAKDPDAPPEPKLPKSPSELDFNPNIRSANPNVRSDNPNIRTTNPNVITPTPTPAPKPPPGN
ncbi:MAG: DUF4124 domain-containing protein [Gammaproteobacteria bacterium]|nr:MAG: DUF4124 domain-containing protein [Gammaproteobacteria bacterium]